MTGYRMDSSTDRSGTAAAHEARAMAALTQRLVDRFAGQRSPEHVRRTVADTQAHFTTAKIRDFLPVLIERNATEQLRRHTSPDVRHT